MPLQTFINILGDNTARRLRCNWWNCWLLLVALYNRISAVGAFIIEEIYRAKVFIPMRSVGFGTEAPGSSIRAYLSG